jgi:hypothetical protein
VTGKGCLPHICSFYFYFVSCVILKTGVVRLSFWATKEEEGGKIKVLCCGIERREIETGNYRLPSLAFWDTEEHRRQCEMETGRAP